jgi:hypothetical protein
MASVLPLRQRTSLSARRQKEPTLSNGRTPYLLSGSLVAIGAIAAAATFFVSGILRGPAVMNGSARGTALVVLVVAAPAVALSMLAATRGSRRALIVWLGAAAYILYNSVMFLFATPFNNLFLLYVSMLSLSIWSIQTVLSGIDIRSFGARFSRRLPVRAIAAYSLAIVVLNFLAWMQQIVPGVLSTTSPAFLTGTGLPTSPVYVQDLAVWLPLMAVGSIWLWRRQPWGYVVVGSVLTMWVIESLGIAVDQWFGHAADPASSVASAAVVPVFAVLAVVGLVPLFFYFRNLDRDGRASTEAG